MVLEITNPNPYNLGVPKVSFEIGLTIAATALGMVQYFLAKSGKSTPLADVLLLIAMAALFAWAALSIPWISSSPNKVVNLWRGAVVVLVIFLAIARFGIWTWPERPARLSPVDASVTPPSPSPVAPPTVHDLFEKEFPNLLKLAATYEARSKTDSGNAKLQIRFQAHFDYDAKSEFVSVYLGSTDVYEVCKAVAKQCRILLNDLTSKTHADVQIPGNPSMDYQKDLVFTGKVFVYYDGDMSLEQLGSLEALFKEEKLSPQFRGQNYATTRWLQSRASSSK